MSLVVVALIILGGLGVLFGFSLALARRRFAVEVDPREERIAGILPGANCGACGKPGCAGFAEAVVVGTAEPQACVAGGQEVVRQVADILGKKVELKERMVAVVSCAGGKEVAGARYLYRGLSECRAAHFVAGGPKACSYGCLGMGACCEACPFEALTMTENGLPRVDESLCTGCGCCVEVCPRSIMKLIPRSQKVYGACVNPERGKGVKEVCSRGCTGCRLCASPKITPSGAIQMEGNLPVIDLTKPQELAKAVEKCPGKCFVVRNGGG